MSINKDCKNFVESVSKDNQFIAFIKEPLPFHGMSSNTLFYNGISWGLLNTENVVETLKSMKKNNINPKYVIVNLSETIKKLQNKFLQPFQDYNSFDEFCSLIYALFLTITEFLINYELYYEWIKDDFLEFEKQRLANSFFLKFFSCFRLNTFSTSQISFYTNSPDECNSINEVVDDCFLTLKLINDPILLRSNLPSSNISYLLEFSLVLSLFDYEQFINLLKRNKNMTYFENIILTSSKMDSRFYRDHYIHSLFVSAQLVVFHNNIQDLVNNVSINYLIFAGLIHDEYYPVEKLKFLITSSTSNLKQMYTESFDFKNLWDFLINKSNLVPNMETYEYNFLKQMLPHGGISTLESINMQCIEKLMFSKTCDHGYLSALFTFKRFYDLKEDVYSEFLSKSNNDIMSLEDFKRLFYEKFKSIIYSNLYHNLKDIHGSQFEFTNDYPFYSFLFFVDTIQEWQRRGNIFLRVLLHKFEVTKKEIKYHIIYIINHQQKPPNLDNEIYLNQEKEKTTNHLKKQFKKFNFQTLNRKVNITLEFLITNDLNNSVRENIIL